MHDLIVDDGPIVEGGQPYVVLPEGARLLERAGESIEIATRTAGSSVE